MLQLDLKGYMFHPHTSFLSSSPYPPLLSPSPLHTPHPDVTFPISLSFSCPSCSVSFFLCSSSVLPTSQSSGTVRSLLSQSPVLSPCSCSSPCSHIHPINVLLCSFCLSSYFSSCVPMFLPLFTFSSNLVLLFPPFILP